MKISFLSEEQEAVVAYQILSLYIGESRMREL